VTRPPLLVIFTLDCPPYGARCLPAGPATWEASARSIDAFCTTLLRAGFPPTLFVTPETADAHGPLLDDLRDSGGGAEVGLLLQPPSLRQAGFRHYLGRYGLQEQQAIARLAVERFADALGRRPLSARSAMYSASDCTFGVLDAAGFRQTSTSSPGRKTPKYHAEWVGAPPDAHPASATNRLESGTLSLLEVPVTTDATQRQGGIAPELAVESGTLERWHAPLIAAQLARQAEEGAPLSLCFVAGAATAFYDPETRHRQTLDDLLAHLETLEESYQPMPATVAGAYAHLRSP
jgi:hypothetical protein